MVRARMSWMALAFFVLGVAPSAHAQARLRIAVANVQPRGVDPTVAQAVTAGLLEGVQRLGPVTVVATADFQRALGADYEMRIYGCKNETECLVQLGSVLPADRLFVGTVAGGAGSWAVTVKMVNLRSEGSAMTVVTAPTDVQKLGPLVAGVPKQLILNEQRSQLGPGGFNLAFETEYSMGLGDYYEDRYAEAHAHLDGAIRANPTPRAPYYYAGLSAYFADDLPHAKAHLLRAKGIGPDPDLEVEYYLGLTSYRLEEFDESEAHFLIVRQTTPDEEMLDTVDVYLALIEKVRERKRMEGRFWKVTGKTGIQHDSNVILSPQQAVALGKEGTRALIGAEAQLWAVPVRAARISGSLGVDQTLHFYGASKAVTNYDMTHAFLNTSGLHYFDNEAYRLQAELGGEIAQFRAAPSFVEMNGSFGLWRRLVDRAALGLSYDLRYDHYYSLEEVVLTGLNHGPTTRLTVDVVQGYVRNSLKLAYDRNQPTKDTDEKLAYNGVLAELGVTLFAPMKLRFHGFGGIHFKFFDREDPPPEPKRHSDRLLTAGAGAHREFGGRWFLDGSFSYYFNDATRPQREFQRWIAALTAGISI
ncbi:MAG: tetratricopeptide repeat protein [Nitrospirae bacterium]|nr:tetratricopeptide repeat protein [Nitrospirota bacterium]